MIAPAPRVSVIVPVRDGARFLARSLGALRRSTFQDFELIVVDDGSRDGSGAMAAASGALVIPSGGRRGAGAARAVGAERARGEIMVFVDADVVVHEGALARIMGRFDTDPSLSAIMGAYDDAPDAQSVVSRFRNLLHAYVHRQARRDAATFWTGLGAVRRGAYDGVGGFSFRKTLEDVELGIRLHRAGYAIALDPSIQGKHLKEWTLASMLTTDVMLRGAPWILLAMRYGGLQNDLNTSVTQRVSVLATGLFAVAAASAGIFHGLAFIAPAIAIIVAMTLPAWRAPDWTGARRLGVMAFAAAAGGASALLWGAGASSAAAAVAGASLAAAGRAWILRGGASPAADTALALLLAVALPLVVAAFPLSPLSLVVALAWMLEAFLNRGFLAFLARRMGGLETLASAPLLLLYHFCCGVSVVLGLLMYVAGRATAAGSPPPARAPTPAPPRARRGP